MDSFVGFTLDGIALGAIYAIAATGLVVTYTTSGVFNFAHGAIGMMMAFVYWQFRVDWHWPAPVALFLTLFVIAPLLGVIIERSLIRRIDTRDVGITLVITLGLLLSGLGIAYVVWPDTKARVLPVFFGPGAYITVFDNRFSDANLIAIGLAAAVALGLRVLLYRTRVGMAMRAVVDDRDLLGLNGGRPSYVNALSWAVGAGLGGLAGVLQATTGTTPTLDVLALTLLVINAFAAAMLGRLRSLPLTFLGALLLGLLYAYVTGYVPLSGAFSHLQPVLPTLFLLMVVLVLEPVRIKTTVRGASVGMPVPTLKASLVRAVVFLVLVALGIRAVHGTTLVDVSEGLGLAVVGLSVVLLTGYGGEVSLAQYAFMGMGAWLFTEVAPGGGIVGLLLVGLCGAAMGVLVALPTLRLSGLYLALSTLAVAELAYYMIFEQPSVMGYSDITVPRVRIPFVSLSDNRNYVLFEAVIFVVFGLALLAVKRGPAGRLLSAVQDSPAAAATLGVSLRTVRLGVFAVSSAMATMGGVLYASAEGSVGSLTYYYIAGLFLVLAVYLWGIRSTVGALIGGLSITALFPLITPHIPTRFANVEFVATGVGVLALARQPNGVVGMISAWWGRVQAGVRQVPDGGYQVVPVVLDNDSPNRSLVDSR